MIRLLSVLLVLYWVEEWRPVVASECIYGDIHHSRCKIPSKPWALDAICAVGDRCTFPDPQKFGFSLTARYLTKQLRGNSRFVEKLYARGSGPGLSWDYPIELRKTGRLDTWKANIEYELDETSFDCSTITHCSYNQFAVEFRIYGDESGEDDMIGPNFFFNLPVSKSAIASDFLSPDLTVFPWFDNKLITFRYLSVSNPHLFRTSARTNNLLALPPSFEYNTLRTYPLVIMFGIDALQGMLQILERGFVHDASIQEVVIVAVEYTGCLLSPYFGGKWECTDAGCAENCLYCWEKQRSETCEVDEFKVQLKTCAVEKACGGSGDIILDYIMNYLIPKVQVETRHRVEVAYPKDRIHIVGYNEGGLLACHAAVKHPHVFKSAACMSAPFHLPEKTFYSGYQLLQMIKDIAASNVSHGQLSLYQTQKYYIDTGDQDSYYYPLVDSYLDAEKFVEEMEENFYMDNTNFIQMNFPKFTKSHVEDPYNIAFIQRVRYPLQMLFPAQGGPNKQYPRINIQFTRSNQNLDVSSNRTSTTGNATVGSSSTCEQPLVTLPIFLGVIGATMLLSIAMTVLIMCLRESNKRSEEEKEDSDLDEMELDTDSSIDYND